MQFKQLFIILVNVIASTKKNKRTKDVKDVYRDVKNEQRDSWEDFMRCSSFPCRTDPLKWQIKGWWDDPIVRLEKQTEREWLRSSHDRVLETLWFWQLLWCYCKWTPMYIFSIEEHWNDQRSSTYSQRFQRRYPTRCDVHLTTTK